MTPDMRLGSNVVELRAKTRKPRILIAGEFSAGKTQLINGLLGAALLPSNVTSTSLPPMWIVREPATPFRLDMDGTPHPFEGVEATRVDDTAFCLLSHPAPILEHMDLIDTPGNSDPNIPSTAWERMLGYADAVVWCSNAVQAWRQSEKSVWAAMPAHLTENATMLITHADRLTEAGADERVMRRVQRDAAPYFASFLMGSLIRQEDIDAVARHLLSLCAGLRNLPGAAQADVDVARGAIPRPAPATMPPLTLPPARPAATDDRGIRPRRVRLEALRQAASVTEATPPAAPVVAAPFMLTEAVRIQPAAERTPAILDTARAALWPESEELAAEPAVEEAALTLHIDDTPAEPAAAPAFDGAAFQSLFAQIIGDDQDTAAESAEPEQAEAPLPAITSAETEEEQRRFVPLIRPAPIPAGPARALWQQIARDYDLSDHQTLADGVELLIEELDAMLAEAGIDLAALTHGQAPQPQPAPLPDDEAAPPLRLGNAGGWRDH